MTIWRMFIACWVSKATNTHSYYVTLSAFPLQHRSQELVYLVDDKNSINSENSFAWLGPFKDIGDTCCVGDISRVLILSLSKAN